MAIPILSVIIPCLNGGATIAEQLEALSSQRCSEPWELIISDNGSTDDSLEIARQYSSRFFSFRIVDASSKRGGSSAINIAAKKIKSDRFAVCDADDAVGPEWVASMANALMNHDVVCGQFKFDKFNEPNIARKSNEAWKNGLFRGRFLPGGGSGNYGIKKWVHELIGGFDECLPHAYDADYFWRLQLEGFMLHHEPEAIVQVRIARVNPSFTYLYHRSRKRAASNYWCYKRYRRYGMFPPPSLKKSCTNWLRHFSRNAMYYLKNGFQNINHIQQAATLTGTVVGDFQGRLTNPCKPYFPSNNKTSK